MQRVERFLGESDETERAEPPEGVVWDLSQVWCTMDYGIIIWRGEREGRPILHCISSESLEDAHELPAEIVMTPDDLTRVKNAAVILNNRLYILGDVDVPEAVRSRLSHVASLRPDEPAWVEIAGPDIIPLILDMRIHISNVANLEPTDPDSAQAAKEVRKLLESQPKTIDADAILGDWKVRSIQGSDSAIYAYPFFKARITQKDGRIFFEKTTGSQRRSGYLYRYLSDTWVFLGGKTVNDDPQVDFAPNRNTGELSESDT